MTPSQIPSLHVDLVRKEQALARGDSDRLDFASLVNEHWTAVYCLLKSLTGNLHDTEDLTQETFLRAFDRIDSFKPGTKLRNWLLRIASNAFFDLHRKRKRVRMETLESEPPARHEEPTHALELAEQSALVRAAMEELTETTRLVFHLRATEDLSYREIAELAGTTEQSARWHMHQARTKLLQRLGNDF